MALPEKIIIVRHGETSADKNDPNRRLTENGAHQVSKVADTIRPNFVEPLEYFSSNRNRAKATLLILAGNTIKPIKEWDFKVESGPRFSEHVSVKRSEGVSPAVTYLSVSDYTDWDVESPQALQTRWLNFLSTREDVKTALIVTHEGAIEAFVEGNPDYLEIETSRTSRFFDYADYSILSRKE